MNLYDVNLQTSTSISACLSGDFSRDGDKSKKQGTEFVFANAGGVLELYASDADTGSLSLLSSVRTFSAIRSLDKHRVVRTMRLRSPRQELASRKVLTACRPGEGQNVVAASVGGSRESRTQGKAERKRSGARKSIGSLKKNRKKAAHMKRAQTQGTKLQKKKEKK